MKRKRCVLVLICCVLVACKKSGPVDSEFSVDAISLDLGTNHVYLWSFSIEDSTHRLIVVEQDSFRVRVAAIGESIGSLTNLAKLEASSTKSDTGASYDWYSQTSSDLKEVAYSGAGRVPVIVPKRSRSIWVSLGQFDKREHVSVPLIVRLVADKLGATIDSIIVRTDPRIVYHYPLQQGQHWVSFTQPFLETREVVSSEDVAAAGGKFRCVKILTKLPEIAPDLEWYDYVSSDGLIKRTVKYVFFATGPNDPAIRDTLRAFEDLELIQRRTN